MQKFRRFYKRHPFGIIRGDLQAWLGGLMSRFGSKPIPLKKAVTMFDGLLLTKQDRKAAAKKRRNQKPPKSKVTGAKLMALCQMLGGEVKNGGQ